MDTATAARALGMSERRVRQLLTDGALTGTQLSGGTWIVDSASVRDRMGAVARRGRPWNEDIVWRTIVALSAGDPAPAAVARRIQANDTATLAAKLGQATAVRRYLADDLDEVKRALLLTGSSAIGQLTDDTVEGSPELHGYAVDDVVYDLDLLKDAEGEVVLHAFKSGRNRLEETDAVPLALIAVDCAKDASVRVRRVGIEALETMRSRWLAAHTR